MFGGNKAQQEVQFKRCTKCGQEYPETVLTELEYCNDGNGLFCVDCYSKEAVKCTNCNTVVHKTNARTQLGKPYCLRCYGELFFKCDLCNRMVRKSGRRERDGYEMCKSCFDTHFAVCFNCGETYAKYSMVNYLNQLVCSNNCVTSMNLMKCRFCDTFYKAHDLVRAKNAVACHNCMTTKKLVVCTQCNSIIRKADYIINELGEEMCSQCDAKLQAIRGYEYKPKPIFHGEGPMYFGVELEIQDGGQHHYKAKKLSSIANAKTDNPEKEEVLYVKGDDTVRKGIELVSHPCSYEYHLKELPWKEVLEAAKEMGYTDDDCGLHVHVSKRSLGVNAIEVDFVLCKLLYLVEKFWDKILVFSRRPHSQIERFARRYGFHIDPEMVFQVARAAHDRDRAVNITPTNTIEFRLFRSTTDYNTFIASLQLVKLLVEKSKSIPSATDIIKLTWEDLFADCQYEELLKYLYTKRLLNHHSGEVAV